MNTATSSHLTEKGNIPAKSVNKMIQFGKHLNSSVEIIDITDGIQSNISVIDISSDDEIIDITDTIYIDDNNNTSKKTSEPSKKKSNSSTYICDSIIDLGEHKNSSTTPINQIIPLNNDIQILNHSACIRKNPIDIITISDDSDEENTLHQQSNKTKNYFKLIKNCFNNIVNPRKRTYSSSFSNSRKKKSKIDYAHKPETWPNKYGAFVIDKQKVSNHSHKTLPRTSKTSGQLRPIIIDGLNIGYAHGVGTFSAKGIELCVKYFAKRGHNRITVFIPHHRQGPPGSKTRAVLHALLKKGHICFTPSRKVKNLRMTCHDDRIMLNYASRCGGVVVSNDNFRDLYKESDAFKKIIEQRQVMITFVKDEIIVPDDQYNLKHYVRSLSDILRYP